MKSLTYTEVFLKQVSNLNKKVVASFIKDHIDHDTTMHLLDSILKCSSTLQLHQVLISLRKFEKNNLGVNHV